MRRLVSGAFFLMLIALWPAGSPAAVWYVDGDNTGTRNGATWSTAFNSIQAGIDAAATDGGGEVWVAAGTYPEALTLKNDVAVYGGFAGGESQRGDRDAAAHPTVIDGSTANAGSPAMHVVTFKEIVNARLDGFTVTGGDASNGAVSYGAYGGGVFMDTVAGDCVLANSTVRNNRADNQGGGLFLRAASPRIEGCTIAFNQVGDIRYGAGMAGSSASPIIADCSIVDNAGNGLYFSFGTPVLERCRILANTEFGLSFQYCTPFVSNSVISANGKDTVTWGGRGGVFLYDADAVITRTVISANNGPGLSSGESAPFLINCLVVGNTDNGLSLVSARGAVVRNCTVSDNTNNGAYLEGAYDPRFVNVIFSGNEDYAIYENDDSSDPVVQACLFFGNVDGEYADFDTSTVFTRVNDLNLALATAERNVGGDPNFQLGAGGTWSSAAVYDGGTNRTTFFSQTAAFGPGELTGRLIVLNAAGRHAYVTANTSTSVTVAGDLRTAAGSGDSFHLADFHLSDGSAALDRGQAAAAPPEDLDGDARPGTDGLLDIGSDEADPAFVPPADTLPPESTSVVLPRVIPTRFLEIAFQASDAESGILYVELYYRKDGGAWIKYGETYTVSPIVFDSALTGGSGRYEFYTVATDRDGNREAPPTGADSVTAVVYGFSGERIYVDADASGSRSGLTWADALHSIDAALIMAGAFDVPEVWVAGGTYPESLVLPGNVAVYGGFAGGETTLDDRDVDAHPTIVDAATALAGGPALHAAVIEAVGNVRIDGLTFTGGQAFGNEQWSDDFGGGMLILDTTGDVVLDHCTFTGNSADTGGGLFIEAAPVRLVDCTITGNSARFAGGLYAAYEPTVIELLNATVRGNTAAGGAGGLYLDTVAGTLRGCDISDNATDGEGGGIYVYNDALINTSLRLEESRVSGNRAFMGGGIYGDDTDLALNGVSLVGNQAADEGGGAYFYGYGDTHIDDSLIAGNQAAYGGGGLYFGGYDFKFAIRNSTISANDGGEAGGGLYLDYPDTYNLPHPPQLINCVVSGNRADAGGGLWLYRFYNGLSLKLVNCTLSANSATTGGGVYLYRNAGLALINTIVERNSGVAVYEGNTSGDITLSDHTLFFGNSDGDLYDADTAAVLSGTAALDALAEFDATLDGDPAFATTPGGTWTAAPLYDPERNQTTLTDAAAAFAADERAGRLLNADRSQARQVLVAGNTATTVTVWGDVSAYVASGEAYDWIDYRLTGTSAAVDSGAATSAPVDDRDGNPRPIDIPGVAPDGSGTEYDRGAYEYQRVDDLFITPTQPKALVAGHAGGPFAPQAITYRLTNLGSASLAWTASLTADWLAFASPAGGTLAPGVTAEVTLQLTSAAATLPIDVYADTLTITNATSAAVQQRRIELRVAADYFTEIFTADDNDIAFQTLTFTPDGSQNFYALCRTPAAAFPTDPAGGTALTLSDNGYAYVSLSPALPFYGQNKTYLYVGANGYLTFGNIDTTAVASLARHFAMQRIAALFTDLDPSAGGQVSWKRLADRLAVTWLDVPQKGTDNTNSFQVEIFDDGRLTLTHLGVDVTEGLVGLSPGGGLPDDFVASNLNGYACSQGMLAFAGGPFACEDTVLLELADRDLAGQGSTVVTLTTDGGDSESVTLSENSDTPGRFSGGIAAVGGTAATGDSVLQVTDGDRLSASYTDADDGSGSGQTVTALAAIDCGTPALTAVPDVAVTANTATISVTANEAVTVLVRYGTLNGNLVNRQPGFNLPGTSHTVTLSGLTHDTTYYFSVELTDAVGNQTVDDNGGVAYAFTTASLPDLQADGLQIPATAATGQQITVTWTVVNSGAATAKGPWNDYLYLSADDVPGSDTRITTVTRTDDLAIDASYTRTATVTLPAVGAGVYWIVAVADGGRSVPELNENDNAVVAGPIAIGQPNLTASDLVVPGGSYVGGTLTINWTVTNTGADLAAAPWYDNVYLSTDQQITGSDPLLTSQLNTASLAVGAHYVGSATVTIPGTLSGDHYLIVKTDAGNFRNETDETDNLVIAGPLVIGQPNLALSAVTAPEQAVIGQAFDVTWTVTNTGAVPAEGFEQVVYLSTDDQPGDDTYLTKVTRTTPLAGSESFTQTASVSLPAQAPGDVWLVVKVDAYNWLSETNEADNLAILGPLAVTGPDLAVGAITLPAALYTGQTLEVTWQVANSGGAAAAGPWYDSVLLSVDDQPGGDQLWLQREHSGGLAAGADYTATLSATVPGVAAGDYWLVVSADSANWTTETEEANNVGLYGPVAIRRPNLAVGDVQHPVEGWTRQEYLVSWTTTNIGTVPAVGAWKDAVYLSTDDQAGGDTLLAEIVRPAAQAAGEGYARTVTVTIPQVADGNYHLIVKSDAAGQVPETDEGDNVYVSPALPVRTTPYANLQVGQAALGRSQVVLGERFEVTWTVLNAGTGATSASFWKDRVYFSVDETLDGTDLLIAAVNNGSFLAAGEGYAGSALALAAGSGAGSYYVLVKTDADNDVYEYQFENDNVTVAGQVQVELPPPPDLTVTVVQAPEQAFSGLPFSLSYSVANIGPGMVAADAWTDAVYLSADTVLDPAADRRVGRIPRLASDSRSPEAPFKVAYSATVEVTLPVGLSGPYYVFVLTDSDNRVNEWAFEDNNAGYDAAPLTVNLTPPPDLEVTALGVPAAATAGQPFTVTYTGANNGATRTPETAWTDAFYLSRDAQFDPVADLRLAARTVQFAEAPGGLAAGADYTGGVTLRAPVDAEGAYYLLAVCDADNRVFELDNANNVRAAALTVESRPADLTVWNLATETAAEAGKALRVEWSVANAGAGRTAAVTWADTLYASSDEVAGNADDVRLGRFVHTGELLPQQSYTTVQTVTVPFSLFGTWRLYVVTDSDASGWGAVFEGAAGESNNTSLFAAVEIIRNLPDLEMTAGSAAIENGRLRVAWTVANTGVNATNVNFWHDAVYVSGNDVFGDGDDLRLKAWSHSGALAAGAAYSRSETVDLPFERQGPLYVFVRADDGGRVDEGGATQNNAVIAGTFTAADIFNMRTRPDLVVFAVDAPADAVSGQPFSLSWTVRNVGDPLPQAAPFPPEMPKGRWTDRVYLSRDQILDPAVDVYLGEVDVYAADLADASGPEGAYQVYTRTRTFQVPSGLTGPFYVCVTTDRGNTVYEPGGEANNSGFDPVALVATLAAPVDLVVGTYTVPAFATLGWYVEFDYTLENQSDHAVTGEWYDQFYLSTDAVYSPDDVRLGVLRHDPLDAPIPANGSAAFNQGLEAWLPALMPGEYTVILRTDAFNQINEADESNNIGASLNTMSIGVAPITQAHADGRVPVAISGLHPTDTRAVFLRFAATAGQTYTLDAVWQDPGGTDQADRNTTVTAYLAWDRVPTAEDYDATAPSLLQSFATYGSAAPLTVTASADGSAYVRIDVEDNRTFSSFGSDAYREEYAREVSEAFELTLTPAVELVRVDREIEQWVVGNGTWQRDLYFKFEAREGATYALDPHWTWIPLPPSLPDGTPWTSRLANAAVFVARDRMPTPYNYDLAVENWLQSFPGYGLADRLILPRAAAGTYYVCVRLHDAHPPRDLYPLQSYDFAEERFNLVVSELPFSVVGLSPAQVGNSGPVTFDIVASNLDVCSTVELLSGEQVVRAALDVALDAGGAPRAFVTFDLAGLAPGDYTLRVTDAGGAVASSAVTVAAGRGPQISARIKGPNEVRMRDYIFYVDYGNSGDADGVAPLLVIENAGVNSFDILRRDLTSEAVPAGRKVQLLGTGHTGPAGTLRPGALGSIPVFFRTIADTGSFRLQVIRADDPRPFFFGAVEDQIRPPGLSDAEWLDIRPRLVARFGTTWGSYVRALGEAATVLSDLGYRPVAVTDIFGMLYELAGFVDGGPPNLSGFVSGSDACTALPGAWVAARDAAGKEIDAVTSELYARYGLVLPAGTYTLTAGAEGYALRVLPDVVIEPSGKRFLNIALEPQATVSGQIELSAAGPPDSPLTATARHLGAPYAEVAPFRAEMSGDVFTIKGLPAGPYQVTVKAPGYLEQGVVVDLAAAEALDLGSILLPAEASVTGNVAGGGQAVVSVFAGGQLVTSAYTDADGNFTIRGLAPGTYTVQVTSAFGGFPEVREVTVIEGQALTAAYLQVAAGGTLSGTVRDTGGSALAYVPVFAAGSGGRPSWTYTGADGTYRLDGLPLGTYRVGVPTGAAAGQQTVSVVDLEGAYSADLLFDADTRLTGRVYRSGGAPLENVIVELFESGQHVANAVSDASGRFTFLLQRGGTFEVRAAGGGAAFAPLAGVDVASGQTREVLLTAGTATLAATPRLPGAAAGAVNVELYQVGSGSRYLVETFETTAGSPALFTNLTPGAYRLETWAAGNLAAGIDVPVVAGGNSVEATLSALAMQTGTVRDAQDNPVAGAAVRFCEAATPAIHYLARTLSDGTFRVDGLPAGSYDVVVSAPGFDLYTISGIDVGSTPSVDVVLTAGGTTVAGRVVAGGGPVPYGIAQLRDDADRVLEEAPIDADGNFAFQSAFGSDLVLEIAVPGFSRQVLSALQISPGGSLDVGDLTVEALATHQGASQVILDLLAPSGTLPTALRSVQAFSLDLGGWIDFILDHHPRSPFHIEVDDVPRRPDCCRNCLPLEVSLVADVVPKQRRAWNQIQSYEDDIDEYRATVVALYVGDLAVVAGKMAQVYMGCRAIVEAANTARRGFEFVNNLAGILNFANKIKDAVLATPRAPSGPDAAASIQSAVSWTTAAIDFVDNLLQAFRHAGLGARYPIPGYATIIGEIFDIKSTLETIRMENVAAAIDQLIDLEGGKTGWVNTYERRIGWGMLQLARYRSCIRSHCEGCADGSDGGDREDDPDPSPDPDPTPPDPPPPPPDPAPEPDPYDPEWIMAVDPNDIVGPDGFGDDRWVARDAVLPYRIRFENQTDAGGPAQRVVVTQQLDADLDFRTFRVGAFGWGDTLVETDGERPFFMGRVALGDGSGLAVDVTATVDVVNGIAVWILQTVDPLTGEAPADARAGFLPPNDDTGRGEGFVSYTIRPRADADNGAVIDAAATIVFDTNEPIDTPPIANTLDAAAPVSAVAEALHEALSTRIWVAWGGADDAGSALKDYDVYVSVDDGAFTPWLSGTTLTGAWFVGAQGHTYAFYCTARDNAGNTEAQPATADAVAAVPFLAYGPGDFNEDHYVNLADAVLVLKVLGGIDFYDTFNPEREVDGDGRVGGPDLLFILQKTAGLRSE